MKKTVFALILMFSLLLALTACGGDKTPATENPGNSDSPVTTDEPGSEAPSDTADPNAAITEEMVRSHAVAPAADFVYDITDNGVKIGGYNGSDTIVVIPEEIEGKPVTEFYDFVFANDSPVRAVLIPESVKTLGQVFINSEKIELVICEGVTKLAGLTFGNCSNLRNVVLGEDLQEIVGLGAFADCPKLEEVHFTNNLTQIESEYTFDGCENLTIYAPTGSYAETFANENNIPFKAE